MGNFFSKEEVQSNLGEKKSEKVSASTATTKSTEVMKDKSHLSFEIGSASSTSKSAVGKSNKSQLSFEIDSATSKSAVDKNNKSQLSFEIDSVASKSNSGSSQSRSISQKNMENPVPVAFKPEKKNKSYIKSKMPMLEAQMYVPKTGEYYEFNSYELGGNFTVLVFYSGNFCSGVLPELHELKSVSRKTLKDYNLLAISTDTKESHKAFSHLGPEEGGIQNLNFVLVADHTGEWSKTFQVYDESSHRAFPSYIILSADMRILYKETFDHNVGGNPNHIIEILNYLMEDKVVGEDVKDTSDNISGSDSSHMRVSSDPEISSTSTKSATSSDASKLATGTTGSTSTKSASSSGGSKLDSGIASSTSSKIGTSSGASKLDSGTGSSVSKKSDLSWQKSNDEKNLPKEPVAIMPAEQDNSTAF